MLTFDYDGQTYEFDQNKLDLTEAIAVKVETGGMTIKAFQLGINELDPDALKAMVWLSLRRAGTAVRYADVTFDVVELLSSIKNTDGTADAADPTSLPEVTPTRKSPERTNDGARNGKTPSDAGQLTSVTLPTT